MRAGAAGVLERLSREDAGAGDEAIAMLGDVVLAKDDDPVAAEMFQLAGRELELGADGVAGRIGVVASMRLVEKRAAGRDTGAERREERALEEVDHDDELVPVAGDRPGGDVRRDAGDRTAPLSCPFLQRTQRRRRVVDRLHAVSAVREQECMAAATAGDVERTCGSRLSNRVESIQGANDEGGRVLEGRRRTVAIVPATSTILGLHDASLYHARERQHVDRPRTRRAQRRGDGARGRARRPDVVDDEHGTSEDALRVPDAERIGHVRCASGIRQSHLGRCRSRSCCRGEPELGAEVCRELASQDGALIVAPSMKTADVQWYGDHQLDRRVGYA